MNYLNNLDETDRESSLALTDDLIRFGRSKVKGQGHSRPKYVVAKLSRRRWNVGVHLLVADYFSGPG